MAKDAESECERACNTHTRRRCIPGSCTGELAAKMLFLMREANRATKLKREPGGKMTRSPVATVCAAEGTFGCLPKIPPMVLLTVLAIFWAVLVRVAELLATVTGWPLIIKEES